MSLFLVQTPFQYIISVIFSRMMWAVIKTMIENGNALINIKGRAANKKIMASI